MRTRRALAWTTAFAIAPLAACSLLVDSDGLAGPEVVTDGATADVPVAPVDAAVDAAEAEAAIDAPPLKGCTGLVPTPKFCQDFDESVTIGDRWTTVTTSAGSATRIALDSAMAFSSPRSAKMNLLNAADCQFDKLERKFPDAKAHAVDARMQVRPTGPWTVDATVLSIVLNGPGANPLLCQVLFNLQSDGTRVKRAGVFVQVGPSYQTTVYTPTLTPKVDEWTAIGMAIREVDGVPVVSATVGGRPALADTRMPGCALGGALELGVGFHCDRTTAEMRVDDVIFDFQ